MRAERAVPAASRGIPWITARSAGWLSIIVVFAIGFLRLAGGLLHVTLLTRVASTWVEMKTITMVCFFLSACALTLIYLRPAANRRSLSAMFLGGVVALVGLFTIADYGSQLLVGHALAVTQASVLNLFFGASTRMALTTACVFTLVGFALVLLATGGRRAAHVAHALALLAAIASYVVPLGYLLGVPDMSAVLGTAMALNTGIAFCFLCLAVFCARTETWLMKALTGDEIGGYMARRLLPALMVTPLVIGWFRLQGERSGLFSSEVGVALVASAYTLVFVVLVWLAARAANRTDARRRAAEGTVREGEKRFRTTMDNMLEGCQILDRDWRYVYINDAAERHNRRPRAELIGKRYMDVWPGIETTRVFDVIRRCIEEGTVGSFENEFSFPGGAVGWFDLSVQPVPEGVFILSVDVTRRKLAEKQAQAELGRFHNVLATMYGGVLLVGDDNRVELANQAFCDIFGLTDSPASLTGLTATDIMERIRNAYEHPGEEVARIGEIVGRGEPVRGEEVAFRGGRTYLRDFIPISMDGKTYGRLWHHLDITERKRAEAARAVSEDQFRAVSESSAVLLVVTRQSDNVILFTNAAFDQAFGYAKGELVGSSAPALYVDPGERAAMIDTLTAKGLVQDMEVQVRRKDGTQFWASTSVRRLQFAGAPAILGAAVDITERKRTEEALRRNEATLRGILDATRESVWLFSTDGVVLQANATALARFGKAGPEVVGKSLEEILTPELAALRRARLHEVVESARPVEFEDERAGMQFRHSFYPVLDARGAVVAVTSFSRDITASRRAEQALRESEARYRVVADNTYDWEFWLDPHGKYLYSSPSCERITGYKPAEFMADPELRFRLAHPDDRQTLLDHINGVEREQPGGLEYRLIHRDGSVRWIGHVCQPIFDAGGEFLGTRGSNRDITERKQAEQTLQESEGRLRKLYSAMSEGLVLHQVAYDGTGKATDYRLVDVNPAFEAITGMSRDRAVGQLASKLYGTGSPPYLDIYARVAETGEPAEFETEFAPMAKCFHISVFSPGKGIFATVFSDITARKQSERRIAEQATMLASANDAIIGYDAGYRTTFWNRSAEQMYGYSEAEALGKVSNELLRPVYIGITREQLVARIAADGHVETESIRTTRDGRQLSVEAHVIALRDEQGTTTGYVSVDRDITERKRAEQALREAKESLELRVGERTAALRAEIEERKRAEERLVAASEYSRSLLEASLDPLVTISPDGKVTDVNEATVKATGVPREQLIGTEFSDYFTETEKAREGYRRVFAECFVTDYPLTIRHRDGRLTDVLYNASVYRDAKGVVTGVFAAARDVTDRKRAEAAVAKERQRFQDVLNMLPAYVVLLAPDYTVPFANRFFEERFGKSLGRRCYDYLFQRAEPCENCESYKVMKTKGPHHWEWVGPDGRNYDIYDFPFTDFDGSPLIMEMGIDVTEQKRAEQALQKAHDSLEVKVAERTADLTRSNADLEQFAYAASHDLQEPLRMVANYVGLLSQRYREHLDDKADRYIDYAVGGAKRMQALVDGLLHYSRVGTKDAPATELDATAVVAEARANLNHRIEETGAVVEVGPLPIVTADRVQLAQVFQNLLDNAMKFHGAAAPKVSVTCRDVGTEWEFAVRDNGIGIDPKHAERIFGVFKRLHTEQEYPGTGIGLALCRKIIERHGGRIHVEPAEGGGSVFLFTLPKLPVTRFNEPAGLQSEEDK
jgi:PAS domain S-box-containing protein